jgi:hypothetical protein
MKELGAVVPYLIYFFYVELCHVVRLLRFRQYRDEDQVLLLGLRAQQTAFLGFPPRRVGRCYWCAGLDFVHDELDIARLGKRHTT